MLFWEALLKRCQLLCPRVRTCAHHAHFARAPFALESRRQYRRQGLAPRTSVVARQPARQLEQLIPDHWFPVEHLEHRLQARLGDLRFILHRHHHAHLPPPPEGNHHAHARHKLVTAAGLRIDWNTVGELTVHRPLERHIHIPCPRLFPVNGKGIQLGLGLRSLFHGPRFYTLRGQLQPKAPPASCCPLREEGW